MLIPENLQDNKIQTVFSGIPEGNISLGFGDRLKVKKNIVKLLQKAKIKSTWVYSMVPQHSDKIIEINNDNINNHVVLQYESYFQCDALFTKLTNVALFLQTADCIPLVMTNKSRTFVGLIHLSWKSTDLSLASKAVEFARSQYKTRPDEMEFLVGPCIRPESYTYKNFIPTRPALWKGFIELDKQGVEHIDNVSAVRRQLILAGAQVDNLFDCSIDTFSDLHFFSHLRDYKAGGIDSGRNGTLVMLKQ
jgi:copper oxidase (laccase) domain-containing protein